MSAVTLYRAQDGSLFETEAEQRAHDASIANKAAIDNFLDRHFPIPAAETVIDPETGNQTKKYRQASGRGAARKAISLWLSENSTSE